MSDRTLTKQEVAQKISAWLANALTSLELTKWSQKCSDLWEENLLEIEDENFLLDVLYQLHFADWSDSVPKDKKQYDCDCSLKREEAEELIEKLGFSKSIEQVALI
ncbi:MAG: hypothetical protein J7647_11015 [Cyanobacteria bacterium SBLK]|nr:hypothetical protein [Cyanobacteria bacterium SBLK]